MTRTSNYLQSVNCDFKCILWFFAIYDLDKNILNKNIVDHSY